ncbi:cytochrome P450 [Mycena sanguinolenta]|nr:cytochrome P450 [Mycena sanguinolenta]
MDGFTLQPVVVAAIALLGGVYLVRSRTVSRARCPPGPSGLPLLGNILQAPAKVFRSLFLIHSMQPVFLIGDITLAKEILDKRSAKFSSRPTFPYHRYVAPARVNWALNKQNESRFIARRLAAGLMAANFSRHLVTDSRRVWFSQLVLCSAELDRLLHPTASIMNILPFLDLIPGPMPWRKRAQTHRKREDALFDKLITRAVSGEASGMNTWAAAFAREDKPEGDQRQLMNVFTVTAVSLQTFILACILYPEWIPHAQSEIDAIVGEDRLPSFKDRPHLPYVEAIVRARFGLPHQSTADDVVEYKGKEYFIPKGSIIFAVSWAIEHEQERFENPNLFQPERFLDDTNNLKTRQVVASSFITNKLIYHQSDESDPTTGLPFKYDDSDSAFSGQEARHEIFANGPFEFPAVFVPRSVQRGEVARHEWAEFLEVHMRQERILRGLLKQPPVSSSSGLQYQSLGLTRAVCSASEDTEKRIARPQSMIRNPKRRFGLNFTDLNCADRAFTADELMGPAEILLCLSLVESCGAANQS